MIIINRFSYIDNQYIKYRCLVPLGLNIILGPYEFSLQATINHHGLSRYCGHYCGNTFYWNDKITYVIHIKAVVLPPHISHFINCLWNASLTRIMCWTIWFPPPLVWFKYVTGILLLYVTFILMSKWWRIDGLWWPALSGHMVSCTGVGNICLVWNNI